MKISDDSVIARQVFEVLLDEIELLIYWKDRDGIYQGVNEHCLRLTRDIVGNTDMVGLSDYEIYPKKIAQKFRDDDAAVIASGTELQFEETLYSKDGFKVYQSSIKKPLYNPANQIIGVIGLTKRVNVLNVDNQTIYLTSREADVLAYLYRGMSAKNIGKKLYISKRTVESHWENIKMKLEVEDRDQLAVILDRNNYSEHLARMYPLQHEK